MWNLGTPDRKGWYVASIKRNPDCIRWWNGEYWSEFARSNYTAEAAAAVAEKRSKHPDYKIMWQYQPDGWLNGDYLETAKVKE
jgi:hypothetical protein